MKRSISVPCMISVAVALFLMGAKNPPALPGKSLVAEDPIQSVNFRGKTADARIEPVDVTERHFSRALRIEVPKATPNRWEVSALWTTTAPLEKGVQGYAVLWLRTAPGCPAGRATALVQGSEKPYTTLASQSLDLDDRWKCLALPFQAEESFKPGGMRLNAQFGEKAQTVEIGGIALQILATNQKMNDVYAALGIKPPKKAAKQQQTDYPLTPTSLAEMGAIAAFPPSLGAFDPSGKWVQTYLIWTNYGYIDNSRSANGWLRIERLPSEKPDRFTLKVEERLYGAEGMMKTVRASILCRADHLASPIEWTIESRITGPGKRQAEDQAVKETGRATDGGYEIVSANGKTRKRSTAAALASHWGLFEAVQRIPDASAKPATFDMLEEMALLKPGQKLLYRGPASIKIQGAEVPLQRFDQIGEGILPFEYYTDGDHRLRVVTTFCRVYILDDQAEKAFDGWKADSAARYERALQRLQGQAAPETKTLDGQAGE